LTSEVGSVKTLEGQVSEVMAEFKRLSCALVKLENLDKICDSLQRITGILTKLVELEGNAAVEASNSAKGGKNEYVA
jgi:hypothetical protein